MTTSTSCRTCTYAAGEATGLTVRRKSINILMNSKLEGSA